jgi:hypothetical protein
MTYRRKQYIGKISNGLLVISPRRRYTSFTGASEGITRTSRRGWQDWEILLPGSATWIRADDWRK